MATTRPKARTARTARRPKTTTPTVGDPTTLQRMLVRRGLNYDDGAAAVRAFAKRAKVAVSVTSGYLSKIANGLAPSLKLGRVIVRWARSLDEQLTLADLGIEVE